MASQVWPVDEIQPTEFPFSPPVEIRSNPRFNSDFPPVRPIEVPDSSRGPWNSSRVVDNSRATYSQVLRSPPPGPRVVVPSPPPTPIQRPNECELTTSTQRPQSFSDVVRFGRTSSTRVSFDRFVSSSSQQSTLFNSQWPSPTEQKTFESGRRLSRFRSTSRPHSSSYQFEQFDLTQNYPIHPLVRFQSETRRPRRKQVTKKPTEQTSSDSPELNSCIDSYLQEMHDAREQEAQPQDTRAGSPAHSFIDF